MKLKTAIITALVAINSNTHAQDFERQTQCYTRSYDKKHLSMHPEQLTKSMRIQLIEKHIGRWNYDFIIEFSVRGNNRKYTTGGLCEPVAGQPKIRCFGECDSGMFNISIKEDTRSILLTLDHITEICRDGESFTLNAGKDDRDFHLDAAPNIACADMTLKDLPK